MDGVIGTSVYALCLFFPHARERKLAKLDENRRAVGNAECGTLCAIKMEACLHPGGGEEVNTPVATACPGS